MEFVFKLAAFKFKVSIEKYLKISKAFLKDYMLDRPNVKILILLTISLYFPIDFTKAEFFFSLFDGFSLH